MMIETSRLLLRPPNIEDWTGYFALWSEAPPSAKLAPNARALDEEQAWARLLRFIGHWQTFAYGPFVVIDRTSGSMIGEVGFALTRRSPGSAFDNAPEGMWRIDQSHQGQGFAKEAMQAAAAWMDWKKISPRTVCMIDVGNIASQHVAASLNFREFASAVHHGNSVVLFERMPLALIAQQ